MNLLVMESPVNDPRAKLPPFLLHLAALLTQACLVGLCHLHFGALWAYFQVYTNATRRNGESLSFGSWTGLSMPNDIFNSLRDILSPRCSCQKAQELMAHVTEKESVLLDVCSNRSTSNTVRGCHFEAMVIRRCSCNNVSIQVGDQRVTVPSGYRDATGFHGQLLPAKPQNGLSFPFDPDFPAIDFFLKSDRHVFAIQVHVSDHDDVTNAFVGLCRQAGWFEKFDCIQLIYLSPEDDVTHKVKSLVTPPNWDAIGTREDELVPVGRITRRALSKDSIACLENLQLPDRCSLNP